MEGADNGKKRRVPAVSDGARKTPDVTREFAQHAQPKRTTNVAGVASGRDAKRRTSQAFSGGDERDRPAGRGRVRGDNAHPAYLRARGHGMAPALLPPLLGRSLRCRDELGTTSGGCPPSARVAPPRGGWLMSRWTRVPSAGEREGRGRGRDRRRRYAEKKRIVNDCASLGPSQSLLFQTAEESHLYADDKIISILRT